MTTNNLNPTEIRVLALLASGSEDFGFMTFKGMARYVRLKRTVIRRACRSLARKGLAEYARGLCTEDGEFVGAGYNASKAGREAADKKLVDHFANKRWQ